MIVYYSMETEWINGVPTECSFVNPHIPSVTVTAGGIGEGWTVVPSAKFADATVVITDPIEVWPSYDPPAIKWPVISMDFNPEPELAKSKLTEYSVTDLIAALDRYNMGSYDRSQMVVGTFNGTKIPVEVLKDWINSKFEHPLRIEEE